jgi:hypothetical protein
MPIQVVSCCTYTTQYRDRTEPEWAALQFVRAIKGKTLRGHVDVPLPGRRVERLDHSTAMHATAWFADIVAHGHTWDSFDPVTLVPLPDSGCALGSAAAPKTLILAQALQAVLTDGTARVLDVLRWAEAIPPAHCAGGTRDPQELYSLLRLTVRRLPSTLPPIVLVDDVIASGGHLRAAAAFLTDCGASIQLAACAGRVLGDSEVCDRPFRFRTDCLPDFQADPDWPIP